ncbi:MAG: hypothetical protein IBX69_07495 [Anaerolineales bacterium]|nr:hypothetical protein [Anaerolineales bacterium]
MKQRFPYGRPFLLGLGFLGLSLIWPIFNTYVPIFLRENFGAICHIARFHHDLG